MKFQNSFQALLLKGGESRKEQPFSPRTAVNKLFIRRLRVPIKIGIYPHEQQSEQILLINITFKIDILQAAASDHISDTIDYAIVAQTILDFAQTRAFQLIESFADQCATLLMEKFNLSWLKLTIKKPSALPNADYAGITIERMALI